MKRVLITGVNGFIGSHLAGKYIENGYKVEGVDIHAETSQLLNEESNWSPQLSYSKIDITNDLVALDSLIKNVDIVIHLAAVVGIQNYLDHPSMLFETNVIGSSNIVKLCINHNKRLVFSSTSEIFGRNPNVPWDEKAERVLGSTEIDRWGYSTSKAVIEHLLHANKDKIDYRIVRFFNVYGPGQNPIFLVSRNIHRVLNNMDIESFDGGSQTRCLTYIDDAIDGIYLVSNTEKPKENVYNIGSEIENTIGEICSYIQTCVPKSSIRDIDTSKSYGNSYEDLLRRVPSAKRMNDEFNWKARITAEEGVHLFYEWAKSSDWWTK